jgi:hypothetical protein
MVSRVLGVLLILMAIVSFSWGAVSFTRSTNVLDVGPIQVRKESKKTIPLPPVVGGVALVAGVALLWTGRGRRS